MDGELCHGVGVPLGKLPQVVVNGDGVHLEGLGRGVRGGVRGRQLLNPLLDKLLERREGEKGGEGG